MCNCCNYANRPMKCKLYCKRKPTYISVIENSNLFATDTLVVNGLNRRMFNELISNSVDCFFNRIS